MAYRKSRISTIDVPTFDGHLNYYGRLSDTQVFLDRLHNMSETSPRTRSLK